MQVLGWVIAIALILLACWLTYTLVRDFVKLAKEKKLQKAHVGEQMPNEKGKEK